MGNEKMNHWQITNNQAALISVVYNSFWYRYCINSWLWKLCDYSGIHAWEGGTAAPLRIFYKPNGYIHKLNSSYTTRKYLLSPDPHTDLNGLLEEVQTKLASVLRLKKCFHVRNLKNMGSSVFPPSPCVNLFPTSLGVNNFFFSFWGGEGQHTQVVTALDKPLHGIDTSTIKSFNS